jgi:hypothetical protein
MYCVPNIMSNLSKELVRRGVLRALGAYVAVVWLLAQGLVDLFPAIGFPDWAIRVFLAVTVSATPLVGLVAWKYDITTRGFLRDKQDVARDLKSPLSRALGQTTRATPQQKSVRSIVVASWKDEKGEQREQEFDARFLVGRDFKAGIRIWDDRVSRQHLEVYPLGNDWCVRDLSSLNGTYVDGHTIDVVKIDRDLEISLDKDGPKIQLVVRVMADTLMTAQATQEPLAD